MSGKRPVILMAILLALVLVYTGRQSWWLWFSSGSSAQPKPEAPLPGKNSISGLQITQQADGRWMVSFEYFYTGQPSGAFVQSERKPSGAQGASAPAYALTLNFEAAKRGANKVSFELQHPGNTSSSATTQVVVRMQQAGKTIVSQEASQTIAWPDFQTWMAEREWRGKTPDQVLDKAVALIDSGEGDAVREARNALERLITQNPQFDPAYVELARVAMKTNWGPEGLHQAETLLQSALQIKPDSVNAKILLGYVYAHQKRYKQAESLFTESAGAKPRNLWLWTNWGELLAMQGRTDQAIAKYREAIGHPRTHDTYDRARLDAYDHLLAILRQRGDIDAMEALHKQRTQEFGPHNCYAAEYALFLVQDRGTPIPAIELAKQALDAPCGAEAARQVLGIAYYSAWAGAAEGQRNELLNQARAFLPAGPYQMYVLSTNERTATVVRQLLAGGESIDQRDNRRMNALAYALQHQDLGAARRLLRSGAHPDAPVGEGDMPVALLPVISSDFEGIRLMQQFGVDYAKLRYQGTTALDRARQMGDRRLIDALDRKANSL